jgi:hypothetical protein
VTTLHSALKLEQYIANISADATTKAKHFTGHKHMLAGEMQEGYAICH